MILEQAAIFKPTKLIDAIRMNEEYPNTFQVPSNEDYALVLPENFVKISNGNERFWVKVLKILNNDQIVGEVANDLLGMNEEQRIHYNYKTKIQFSLNNVLQVEEA